MAKVDAKSGRYSKALIDRIDGISDEKEYDPYKAGKKKEVSNAEMFDDNLYADEEDVTAEDIEDATGSMKIIAALFVCIVIIAATVITVLKLI